MRSPAIKQNGIVAILDALGAATYTDPEIGRFLESRGKVLQLLDQNVEGMSGILGRQDMEVFTFNDTVLIVYKTDSRLPSLEEVISLFSVLRKFLVDSLSQNILFRGAVAIGTFYVDGNTNTVMGQAVTDAAAWYDKADWIGVHATPRASMTIQRWLERPDTRSAYVMLDYDVPLRDGKRVRVKAVNWPKVFFVRNMTPCAGGQPPREKLLELLSAHAVPIGTEQKFYNTLSFFDRAVKEIGKHGKVRRVHKPIVRR